MTPEDAIELVRLRLLDAKEQPHGKRSSMGKRNREIINNACQIPADPAYLLQLWLLKYGRPIPYAVKKGLGDACTRLYDEDAVKNWDWEDNDVRFRDVIRMCHPVPRDAEQEALFGALTSRTADGGAS